MNEGFLTFCVCTALIQIGTRVATGFDQHFAEPGIPQSQFRILLAVWEQVGPEGIAPSVLAHHLLIEHGTISVPSSRMVERGWRADGREPANLSADANLSGRELLQKVIPRAMGIREPSWNGLNTGCEA